MKKETLTYGLSREFCKNFKNAYFEEHLRLATSEIWRKQLCDLHMVLFIAFNSTSETHLEPTLFNINHEVFLTKIVNNT